MSAVTYATAQILRVLPRQRIGQAIGRLADSPLARAGRARRCRALFPRLRHRARRVRAREDRGVVELRRLLHAQAARRARARSTATRAPCSARPTGASSRWGASTRAAPSSSRGGATRSTSWSATRTRRGASSAAWVSSSTSRRATTTACTRPWAGTIRRIRSMPGDYYPGQRRSACATSTTSSVATAASPSRSTPTAASGASPSSWSWR